MIEIYLVCSPLYLIGLLFFIATKSGTVPRWLKWWRPMTKKLLSIEIDSKYSHAEKIKIDGISFFVFGGLLSLSFTVIFLIIDSKRINEAGIAVLILFLVAASKKLNEYLVLKIMKATNTFYY